MTTGADDDPAAATLPGPLPDLEELLAGLRVVRLPMRVIFRGVTHREAVLLQGPAGWGEFAPFPEYGDAESSRWLAAALEAGWTGWPAPLRSRVPVNATVPAVPPHQVPEVLGRYRGCTTAKVKVAEAGMPFAESLRADTQRVAAVRAVLGDAARIRIDANGGWGPDQARTALRRLAAYDLEYAEQPCATVQELAGLRRALREDGIGVPVAADESVRRAEDPVRVAQEQAADLIVVKVAPLGGVRAALRTCRTVGLPAVVSSALDTSVGLAAGAALAASLPELPYACGLGTAELLAGDVATDPLAPTDGHVPVGPVAPDEGLLHRWQPDAERRAWWQARVARCHALLAAGLLASPH